MDLLTKFETIEVKADARISEVDRNFCAAHQAAYENARTSLAELGFIWNDMLNQQRELLTLSSSRFTFCIPSLSPKSFLISAGHTTFP